MWTIDEGIAKIRDKGLKITSQRVGILNRLIGRKDHPSAEQIFKEMKGKYPTLSFATIYSTAQILEDAGLISILTIDGHRVFFDPDTEPHAHFRCRDCGKVSDMPMAQSIIKKIIDSSEEKVDSLQVYCYGICRNCLSHRQTKACAPFRGIPD